MVRRVPIEAVQPSQLYVDAASLRELLDWFDPDDPNYEPIPVLDPDEHLGVDIDDPVLSDGHTRAFAAHLSGADELRIVDEPDADGLSLDVYRTCLEWCLDAGITEPADLAGRLVSRERFLADWVARCQALDP